MSEIKSNVYERVSNSTGLNREGFMKLYNAHIKKLPIFYKGEKVSFETAVKKLASLEIEQQQFHLPDYF